MSFMKANSSLDLNGQRLARYIGSQTAKYFSIIYRKYK